VSIPGNFEIKEYWSSAKIVGTPPFEKGRRIILS